MFRNQTEAKKAIEAGGAQADIGDIEKDMNQVSLGKRKKKYLAKSFFLVFVICFPSFLEQQ